MINHSDTIVIADLRPWTFSQSNGEASQELAIKTRNDHDSSVKIKLGRNWIVYGRKINTFSFLLSSLWKGPNILFTKYKCPSPWLFHVFYYRGCKYFFYENLICEGIEGQWKFYWIIIYSDGLFFDDRNRCVYGSSYLILAFLFFFRRKVRHSCPPWGAEGGVCRTPTE